jgi:hypothetical protein
MNEKYLGDSYDFVKRFICSTLAPIAALYAHERFVPGAIRERYTKITGIPMLSEYSKGGFGVLLDPDTGVCLPEQKPLVGATRSHISLEFIINLNNERHPDYIVCFDQSCHRKQGLSSEAQRERKMKVLQNNGLSAFYYASHAPFLLTAQNREVLGSIFEYLRSAGINERLFQRLSGFGQNRPTF